MVALLLGTFAKKFPEHPQNTEITCDLRCAYVRTNLLAEVKVTLLQQAEELLHGGDRGSFHIHQSLVVTLGLPGPPERLQPNDCIHL